jgi:hypothetical protein
LGAVLALLKIGLDVYCSFWPVRVECKCEAAKFVWVTNEPLASAAEFVANILIAMASYISKDGKMTSKNL